METGHFFFVLFMFYVLCFIIQFGWGGGGNANPLTQSWNRVVWEGKREKEKKRRKKRKEKREKKKNAMEEVSKQTR